MNRRSTLPCGSFKRNRRLNTPTSRKQIKGGWSVPPAYVPDSGDCASSNGEKKHQQINTGKRTCIDLSSFHRGSISEHDPESTRQSNKTNKTVESTNSRNNNRFQKFFPQLDFFRRTKLFSKRKSQEQALGKVVKQIWEEGRDQRLEMMDGWTGDLGLALFIPIDWEELEAETSLGSEVESTYSDCLDDGMEVEDDPDAKSSPPILSYSQLNEIHTNLPPSVTLMTWSRAYSLNRDGDHFGVMMEKVINYQHTLIVIRTSDGDILGGYADTAWGDLMSARRKRTSGFFGGGKAFLFATKPDTVRVEDEISQYEMYATDKSQSNTNEISFYPWTGVNEYSQICDVRKGYLGMGGGGSFGWFIQDHFTTGSSGPCLTFRNPSLTKGVDGHFKVVDLEIYGFKSMSERPKYNSSSQISLSNLAGRRTRSLSNASSTISMFD